ncbi:unnamed protein product [Closterium sp. NIES-54]
MLVLVGRGTPRKERLQMKVSLSLTMASIQRGGGGKGAHRESLHRGVEREEEGEAMELQDSCTGGRGGDRAALLLWWGSDEGGREGREARAVMVEGEGVGDEVEREEVVEVMKGEGVGEDSEREGWGGRGRGSGEGGRAGS